MTHDVFISYSTKNKTLAGAVSAKLEESKKTSGLQELGVIDHHFRMDTILYNKIRKELKIDLWNESCNYNFSR